MTWYLKVHSIFVPVVISFGINIVIKQINKDSKILIFLNISLTKKRVGDIEWVCTTHYSHLTKKNSNM